MGSWVASGPPQCVHAASLCVVLPNVSSPKLTNPETRAPPSGPHRTLPTAPKAQLQTPSLQIRASTYEFGGMQTSSPPQKVVPESLG